MNAGWTIGLVAQPPGRRFTMSLRYRLLHHLPALRTAGHRITGLTAAGRRPVEPVEVRWCLRPEAAATGRHRLAIADYDDLTWADAAEQPAVRTGRQSASTARRRSAAVAAAAREFRHATVSTTPLADALRQLVPGIQVAVVPNEPDPAWVAQGRRLHRPWQPGDPLVIRYVAGTPGHDRDLATVAGPLAAFVREHPTAIVETVGPVAVDPTAFPPGRVRQRGPVPFDALPALLAASWITIAPLEDTAFNRAKSAIKFLESAAFGCPCIATPIPDLRRCAEGGVVLTDDDAAWMAALRSLLDPAVRQHHGERGRGWIDAQTTAAASTRILLDHLRAWMAVCG